jgi:proteasome assembly chaperone (PAC2) family protein
MSESKNLQRPWLVAVWPGMGHVALSSGYYLLAKLSMHELAEFSPRELFEVDHVDVQDGLIRPGRLPRSRLFLWVDPRKRHDLIVFIGEAQPPIGKYMFCQRLIQYVQQLGVERVFTFAAMATQMLPEHESRVFAAATDEESLHELRRLELELVKDGNIGGLNGVLLGVAAESGLRGTCLLGEMPHLFAQFPFPKASLAVLEVFTTITGMELDLGELSEQARAMEERLTELLARVEQAMQQAGGEEEPGSEEAPPPFATPEPGVAPEDQEQIERLFALAEQDRSKAFELKRLLDHLGVFAEYEDRFLDLFKRPE